MRTKVRIVKFCIVYPVETTFNGPSIYQKVYIIQDVPFLMLVEGKLGNYSHPSHPKTQKALNYVSLRWTVIVTE